MWPFSPSFGERPGKVVRGVFPFYGKLYNRFRRDEIGFSLWPLYGYSKGDGTTRTNVLWPLFSFYSGRRKGSSSAPSTAGGDGATRGGPPSCSGLFS